MAYPDLYNDESKILETRNIKVKSVSFDAVLTSRRLILLDSKKHTAPPQEILLATLKNVDSGENAIRDPTITISIITNTGTTRQMILTFSKASGGERKREADEWVKALRQYVSQTFEHPVLPDIPTLRESETTIEPENPMPAIPPARIEIVNAPLQKKRIEISRPMKKIIESEPVIPQPVETSSLPTGTFCNRCGSRVPLESAFCNRCGTPVVKEKDLEAAQFSHQQAPAPPQPVPQEPLPPEPVVVPQPPVVTPEIHPAMVTEVLPDDIFEEAPAPVSEVPQVAVPVHAAFGRPSDNTERPIQQVIHSIEPLIEGSVPRTEPAPLIPTRHTTLHVPEQPRPEPPAEKTAESDDVKWPVIAPTVPSPNIPPADAPAAGSPTAPPEIPLQPSPKSGKGKVIAIALLAIVVIAAIAGVFIFANPFQPAGDNTPAPTPEPTPVPAATTVPATTAAPVVTATTAPPEVAVTATPAPASQIPQTGVWVYINYPNEFKGTVGTVGAERDVSDSGEKFYQISTSTGMVSAKIQKVDGSGDPLTVSVFKNGELITKKTTTGPKGIVEIQVSLKPAATPEPTIVLITAAPTTATAINATANATSTG